jgi:hypothetical protein
MRVKWHLERHSDFVRNMGCSAEEISSGGRKGLGRCVDVVRCSRGRWLELGKEQQEQVLLPKLAHVPGGEEVRPVSGSPVH